MDKLQKSALSTKPSSSIGQEIDKVAEKYDTKQKDLEKLTEEYDRKETQLEKLTKEYDRKETQLEKLTKEYDAKETELERLTKEYATKQAEVKEEIKKIESPMKYTHTKPTLSNTSKFNQYEIGPNPFLRKGEFGIGYNYENGDAGQKLFTDLRFNPINKSGIVGGLGIETSHSPNYNNFESLGIRGYLSIDKGLPNGFNIRASGHGGILGTEHSNDFLHNGLGPMYGGNVEGYKQFTKGFGVVLQVGIENKISVINGQGNLGAEQIKSGSLFTILGSQNPTKIGLGIEEHKLKTELEPLNENKYIIPKIGVTHLFGDDGKNWVGGEYGIPQGYTELEIGGGTNRFDIVGNVKVKKFWQEREFKEAGLKIRGKW